MNGLLLGSVWKELRNKLVLVSLLTALSLPLAADDDPVNSADVAAEKWLAEIDNGKYEQSYAEGCLAFQNKVPLEQWKTVLKALRAPLGSLLSRKLVNHSYRPDGFQGLQGECMILTYNTAFTKVPTDMEMIILKREDGQWRGAGYNAQPQGDAQNDADNPPPAEAHTEVNQEPVK